MKKIIALVVLTLTLSVISRAQQAAGTKTICKGNAVPAGYTTVGETQSSDCPNGAWIIKQRATPNLKLDQSADRPPRMIEESSNGTGRSSESSASDALAFAQKVFDLLSRGDVAVEGMIDWDNLKLEGKDFGAMLKQVATSTHKDVSVLRREMITNFGSYYKGSGDGPFNHWRVDSRTGEATTIAANSAKGETILFSVSLKGGKQVVSALSSRK